MKTKLVFSTIIGRVPVCADLTLNMSDEFLSGDVYNSCEHVTACVSVEKANANTWTDGHKRFNINFRLAVSGDIRALQKLNEEYAAKETNGRHHVDLKTLKEMEFLLGELEAWADNEVYGFVVEKKHRFKLHKEYIYEDRDDEDTEDEEWEETDKCWGFYGDLYKDENLTWILGSAGFKIEELDEVA